MKLSWSSYEIVSIMLAAALAVAASGCADDGRRERDTFAVGLLFDGVCLGTANSTEWTVGIGIRNDSDETMTLQVLTIDDPENMSVLGTAVLAPSYRIGGVAAWPPTDQDEFDVPMDWWADRQPVAGSTMAPGDDRELNIGLKSESDEDADTDALLLHYSGADGRQYQQRIPAEIYISGDCDALREEHDATE